LCYDVSDFSKREIALTVLKSYQRFATRCLEEARKTSDSKQKALFTEMAQEWQRLAERAAVVQPGCTNVSEPDRGD
jgi:hypothetical protein